MRFPRDWRKQTMSLLTTTFFLCIALAVEPAQLQQQQQQRGIDPCAYVSSLTLVNATSHQDIGEVPETIYLKDYPTKSAFNIRANIVDKTCNSSSGRVRSVLVKYKMTSGGDHGEAPRTRLACEDFLPFTVFGDSNPSQVDIKDYSKANYNRYIFPNVTAKAKVRVTPFFQPGCKGAKRGKAYTQSFRIEAAGGEKETDRNPPKHDNKRQYYTSSNKSPFKVSIELFGQGVTAGYSSLKDFKSSLENAAKFTVNAVLKRNAGVKGYGTAGNGRQNPLAMPMRPAVPGANFGTDGQSRGSVGDQVDDYGTNNQEQGVEEGTMIVSDGTYVYSAYGDYLVVWDARSGDMVSSLQLPPVNASVGYWGGGGIGILPMEDAMIRRPYFYQPKPYIQALLIHESRLLVVAGGYSLEHVQALNLQDRAAPILFEYLATHVRLYDTSSLATGGALDLVGKTDVHGSYIAVRSVNGKANIVTTTGIDTYTDLIAPFELYNFPKTKTDEQYYAAAKQTAEQDALPGFIDELVAELTVFGTRPLPNLARISLWENQLSTTGIEEIAFGDGIINTLAQIHTLDMQTSSDVLTLNVGGAFTPSYWAQVYSSLDTMILAGQGWYYDETNGISTELTCLIGVEVSGNTPLPRAVGTLEGSVMNSYSIDVAGDILRIATTVRNFPMFRFVVDPVPATTTTDEVVSDSSTNSSSGSTDPPLPTPAPTLEASRTQNYIITMQIPSLENGQSGVLTELDRLQLGLPNEVFTAVRFLDDVAYAVTFERKDPLYIVNVTDPSSLKILGELHITGFSTYMQYIDDGSLLAIGQEADQDGTILGVKISIFDVRNKAKPTVAQSYTLEIDPNTYSSTDAFWDFHTIRYFSGHLIIPLDIYKWDNNFMTQEEFHGFKVFRANRSIIEEVCSISHSPETGNENFCFYCAYLPTRSMVFDGKAMTTMYNSVRSTTIDTCEEAWSLDITSIHGDKSEGCCGVYYF